MSLRVRLLAVITFLVAGSVGLLYWGAERYARQQFQESDEQRSQALVTQFQQELTQRGVEVSSRVQSIADAESTLRMVMELSRPQADLSLYSGDARGLAASRQLDFLELVGSDGTLISSAQWPERAGYKTVWVSQRSDWNQQSAFLDRVESPEKVNLALLAVRQVHVGDRDFYIIGGQRLESDFLGTLAYPPGMRALFYRNMEEGFVPGALSDMAGPVADAEPFAPLIKSLQTKPRSFEQTIDGRAGSGVAERFVTLPLTGRRGELLGALLLGSTQGPLTALVSYMRELALLIGACGILLAFVLSWWVAAHVSRPLVRLAGGIDDVTAGDWDARVESGGSSEILRVVRGFNRMTASLAETGSRRLRRERVLAWRELGGKISKEMDAAIEPLQQSVESLRQAREQTPERFDEIFFESLTVLREKLGLLHVTAAQLAEFAILPELQPRSVNVNEVAREAVKLLEPKFSAIGRPPITPELYLDEKVALVRADSQLLRKAVDNILAHALEDMPTGGTLTVRTREHDGMAQVVISDTGAGADLPDDDHRFAPYREGREGGGGLRLATIQAIVSDLGGKISMESARGAGTTFYLDLPIERIAATNRARSVSNRSKQKAAKAAAAAAAAVALNPEPTAETSLGLVPIVEAAQENRAAILTPEPETTSQLVLAMPPGEEPHEEAIEEAHIFSEAGPAEAGPAEGAPADRAIDEDGFEVVNAGAALFENSESTGDAEIDSAIAALQGKTALQRRPALQEKTPAETSDAEERENWPSFQVP